jgi:hypothetical protein
LGEATWETIELGERMADGLLSESSSIMVLCPGQKTVLELPHPKYMLNCIIRLQAVVEIITNETARALN